MPGLESFWAMETEDLNPKFKLTGDQYCMLGFTVGHSIESLGTGSLTSR